MGVCGSALAMREGLAVKQFKACFNQSAMIYFQRKTY
jgi:hypothetical protein